VLGAGLMYSYELKNQQTPAAVYLKKD
jgi:hypothetical protein